MSEEVESIILLKKEYAGFESFFDYYRDVAEVCDFPDDEKFKMVKGEFGGTIKVLVTFEPSIGDFELGEPEKEPKE